jgi:hypothetical protein
MDSLIWPLYPRRTYTAKRIQEHLDSCLNKEENTQPKKEKIMTLQSCFHFESHLSLREREDLLSVKIFTESQNSSTRQNHALPSVTLGKELHSAKLAFAECRSVLGTRQRKALGKGLLCRVQHSVKKALGKINMPLNGQYMTRR